MTPKEKAQEIYRKYWVYFTTEKSVNSIFKHAKQCALIAVDEILPINSNPKAIEFYQQVKQEIEAL